MINQFLCIYKQDLISGITGISANPCCYHALADTGRTNNDDVLMCLYKVQFSQCIYLCLIYRRIKAVINVIQS